MRTYEDFARTIRIVKRTQGGETLFYPQLLVAVGPDEWKDLCPSVTLKGAKRDREWSIAHYMRCTGLTPPIFEEVVAP